MSDCERIVQVTQDKWANEQIAHFLFRSHKNKRITQKNCIFCTFFTFFYKFLKKGKDSLIPSEQSERIAQVIQDKWATVSDSLSSLRRNERSRANRSGRSPKMSKGANCSLFERITHSLTFFILAKNERFAPKFDERIPNPGQYTVD